MNMFLEKLSEMFSESVLDVFVDCFPSRLPWYPGFLPCIVVLGNYLFPGLRGLHAGAWGGVGHHCGGADNGGPDVGCGPRWAVAPRPWRSRPREMDEASLIGGTAYPWLKSTWW